MAFTMKGFKYKSVKNLTPGQYKATIVKAGIEKSTNYQGFEEEKLCIYFEYESIGAAVPDCKRYDSRPENPKDAEKWDLKFSRFVRSFNIGGNPSTWLGKTGTVEIKKMNTGRLFIDFPEETVSPEDLKFEDANFAGEPAPDPTPKGAAPTQNDSGFPEDIPF